MSEQNLINKLDEDIEYAKVTEHLVKEQKQSLEKLLAENLKYNRAIYEDTQKIRRYMFWRTIINIIWIFLIVAPIILAFIYLPPALGSIFNSYQELLGTGESAFDLMNQLNQLNQLK